MLLHAALTLPTVVLIALVLIPVLWAKSDVPTARLVEVLHAFRRCRCRHERHAEAPDEPGPNAPDL